MTKNILITGTSTGVGFACALLFAKAGYKVYATMRNLDKAQALKDAIAAESLNIDILPLDVTQTDTIEQAVAHIIAADGKIDVLLNNAGAGFAKTTEQASEAEIDWVTNVNYLGVVRVTKAVLPHMRQARAGHILNVSSVGGLVGQPFNELYCAAKFAVEGYTEGLASYLTPAFNIQFSLIEPGGIATEFMNSAVSKTLNADGELATGDYAPIMQKYLAGTQKRASEDMGMTYQTSTEVGEVILQVAQAGEQGNAPLRVRTSDWAEQLTKLKTQADPDGTKMVAEIVHRFL